MTHVKGFWSEIWDKQQQDREHLCDWELAPLQTIQPTYLALLSRQQMARLAVTAQLVLGVQMPLKTDPRSNSQEV